MTQSDVEERLRQERDGYKAAYGITAEELGAARVLIDRYQKMFESVAAERFGKPEPRPDNHLDPAIRSFLIIGNGRTGSTWLLTSADQLPDVVAQREINWRLPGDRPQRGIAFIDGGSTSIRTAIAVANNVHGRPTTRTGEATTVGSKLIFDPYGFNGPEVFQHLAKIIEPDVRLIGLRRSYLEWWLSWKARGVYHDVDLDAMKRTNSAWESEFASLTSRDKPRTREIVLTSGGVPLADTAEMTQPIHYPLRDAIDDMLMAFSNDLGAADLVRARGGLLLDYSEVGQRFSEIARFIGTVADREEIDRISSAPVTRKLDTLPAELVQPSVILVELNDILLRGLQAPSPIQTWGGRRSIELMLPELAAFLRKHGIDATGASYGVGPSNSPDVVVWQTRKPIYRL